MNDHPTNAAQKLTIEANGLDFVAFSQGQGRLVLCLHGFPDSAHTWAEFIPTAANAGYRVVAPFMRGYTPTEAPSQVDYRADYSVPTLGRDVLALADALGAREFFVVGHDWGAAAAYMAAALAPERVLGIIGLAVPPLRCLRANACLRQLRRSWYMGLFQLPVLPERRLARDDGAFIDRLWRDWSPNWDYRIADIAPVKAIMADPVSRRAALGYYRALPALIASPRYRRDRRLLSRPLAVPALILAGTQDGCIGPGMFAGAERCFARNSRLETLAAGHFMHREQPAQFARSALAFLDNTPRPQ